MGWQISSAIQPNTLFYTKNNIPTKYTMPTFLQLQRQ